MVEYSEKGGLRWGYAFHQASNATWPFARISVSPEQASLTLKFLNLVNESFDLQKGDIAAIRKMRGLFSVGIQFEHRNQRFPPFLLFWIGRKSRLITELRRMGYEVED